MIPSISSRIVLIPQPWRLLSSGCTAASLQSLCSFQTSSSSEAQARNQPAGTSGNSAERKGAAGKDTQANAKRHRLPRVLKHITKAELAQGVPDDNAGNVLQMLHASQPAESAVPGLSSSDLQHSDQALAQQLRASGTYDAARMDLVKVLRRYNYSIPALEGQTILACVLRVDALRIHVDPGFYGISALPRSEVTLAHVHTADGQPPSNRRGFDDIRVGDMVRVQLSSLYTPYGDMQLEPLQADNNARRRAVWQELQSAKASGKLVYGRVLNACTGGYAVGISGVVALLPYGRYTAATVANIGGLAAFRVEVVEEVRSQVVVSDAVLASQRMGLKA